MARGRFVCHINIVKWQTKRPLASGGGVMDVSTFPTKGNLIKAYANLQLSKQGYDMLDKKRNILITEMMSLIGHAEEVQANIDKTFSQAYRALQKANISLGINTVRQVGISIPEENSVRLRFKSIMGIEIPELSLEDAETKAIKVNYSFFKTNYFMDEAYINFNKVKILVLEMAEIENTIMRLANNIMKTQKRANALKSIIIPKYEQLVSFIQNSLEEKDREEISRLHVLKKLGGQIP